MIKVYLYDGSFEGFLCAVSVCLEQEVMQPEFVRDVDAVVGELFCNEISAINTIRGVALTFRSRFVGTVSQEAFASARYAFHSQKAGVERMLWRYLVLGLEMGPRLNGLLATEPVHSVNRVARRVSREAHKFKGFVRFREVVQGFLYAAIEPENDILPLIASHFVGRVGDRPWVIHDLRRLQAAVFDLQSWRLIREVELMAAPRITVTEHDYAALWQRYFQRHAIQERHNPKLQQKHVPLRYRKHLVEFNPSDAPL